MTTRKKKKKGAKRSAGNAGDGSLTQFDLENWVRSIEPVSGCKTCHHEEASETIRSLLRAMAKTSSTHVTLRQLHRKVREIHPDYTVGYWGFRSHLREHESDLYAQARGKN